MLNHDVEDTLAVKFVRVCACVCVMSHFHRAEFSFGERYVWGEGVQWRYPPPPLRYREIIVAPNRILALGSESRFYLRSFELKKFYFYLKLYNTYTQI